MGLFHQLALKFATKQSVKQPFQTSSSPQTSNSPQTSSSPQTGSIPQPSQPSSLQQSSPPTAAPRPRSLTELEQQIEQEAKQKALSQPQPSVSFNFRHLRQRLIWTAVLLGVPLGALVLVNLPYSPIRRPVAQKAPLLLIPSYVSMDHHFRQATASLEAARQLIDNATAPADLDLGEQKLKQAQTSLDQLPTWVWSELSQAPDGYWWYHSRFNRLGLNSARSELGRLQGKLFQEKNAQTAFGAVNQALDTATQQYKQAKTPIEQQVALSAWQSSLDQMAQVPSPTLASKMAQQRIQAAQRDFQAIGGLAAGNQTSLSKIAAARQFAQKAAQASQHPPHSVAEWQSVNYLWQAAIDRLQDVSSQDVVGYAEAQKLLATYTANQGEIKIRQQAEADAVAAFQQAEQQINALIASANNRPTDRGYSISQLQQIIRQLEAIGSGTTVYPEAQKRLVSAQQKLMQWQAH